MTKADQRSSWFAKVTIPDLEAIAEKARDMGFLGVVETSGYYPNDGNLGRVFDKVFNVAYSYGQGKEIDFFMVPYEAPEPVLQKPAVYKRMSKS